jgi:nucleoid-associated protein YgaU
MRKDAKIGFAIGGVLLVVLFVYATVVSKHKKPNTPISIVTIPTNDSAATPPLLTGGNASAPSSPVTTPVDPAPVAHPDATANSTPPTPVPPVVDGGTPAPTETVTKPEDQKPEKITGLTPDRPVATGNDSVVQPKKPGRSHTAEMEVPVAAGDRTYVVQPGQTLSSIASEVYGNARFWVAIQRENKSINPNQLKVGMKINLPDITPLQPGVVEEASEVEVPANVVEHPHAVTPPAARPAPVDAHSYVVKAGDSLYKIARTMLGSGRKADALYALNKDLLGPDKSKLKLGMVLKLPESASTGLASSAPVR